MHVKVVCERRTVRVDRPGTVQARDASVRVAAVGSRKEEGVTA